MHIRIAILVVLLVLLAACGGASPTPTQPAEDTSVVTPTTAAASEDEPDEAENTDLQRVRVGYVPVTIYAPFYIALEKGYFREEGIEAELIPVEGGTENVVQVSAGNFEVAGGGIGAGMLNATARGVEFEIAAPLHTERPPLTSPLVVSKARYDSGEITEVSDLRGMRVSTNAVGAATEYWLWAALQQGGLDFADVEVLGVGFREVAPALESGSLDGAILGEPLATLAEQQGLIARLSEDFLDGFGSTMVYFNSEWSSANPELAAGFIKAYLRGARDLNGDLWYDEENLAIIEKYTSVPAAVIAEANRSFHDPNGEVPVDDIMTLQSFFMDQGQLSYTEPLDMSQFVNSSYVEQALQELGGAVEWE